MEKRALENKIIRIINSCTNLAQAMMAMNYLKLSRRFIGEDSHNLYVDLWSKIISEKINKKEITKCFSCGRTWSGGKFNWCKHKTPHNE